LFGVVRSSSRTAPAKASSDTAGTEIGADDSPPDARAGATLPAPAQPVSTSPVTLATKENATPRIARFTRGTLSQSGAARASFYEAVRGGR
jgi:hypothetical protein